MSGYSAILSICALAACAPVVGVQAEYCSAVNAHGRLESGKLAASLDRFAVREGLSIDRSNPVFRVYESADRLVLISVSFGMGDHGAIIALYRLDPGTESAMHRKLTEFVDANVAREFQVTMCSKIKGFRNPVIFK